MHAYIHIYTSWARRNADCTPSSAQSVEKADAYAGSSSAVPATTFKGKR